MEGNDNPEMQALRTRIDRLDERLVALMAERTRLIDQAAAIKARGGLQARIPARVEEVVQNARRNAAQEGLDPELAETVWRAMIDHFIAQEERRLSQKESP